MPLPFCGEKCKQEAVDLQGAIDLRMTKVKVGLFHF